MAGRVETDSPAGETALAGAGASDPVVRAPAEQLELLLVDDRPENLHALKAVLAPLAFPVVTASSGHEALRMLLERDFAVILLDVRMPGLDGLETAELIKQRERTRDIPIVFLTAAEHDVADVIRAYHVGAVDYIRKPFDADLLRSKVAIFVELQRSRRALERSEAMLSASFGYAPIGKTVLDGSLRIVRANPAFARLMGREPAELEGVEASELCHPDDCDGLLDALRAVADGKDGPAAPERGGADLRLRPSDGGEVWVALVASTVEQADVADALLLAQWVDLSARRRAEQARAELLLEQSARGQAEQIADRLHTLQTLTDALSGLSLQPMVEELAARIAELFDADEVVVALAEPELLARAAAAARTVSGDNGDLRIDPTGEDVSMTFDRQELGTISVRPAGGRMLEPGARSLLYEAADRAALSIRQAQLHEADHRIAVELQRGLLPKRLPEVPGVELAAHYEAAGAGAEVGGDWYDLFTLPDGRLAIVLGDVTGSGIPAASTMGQLRSVTRAYAVADDGARAPGEVLARLNRYQFALEGDQTMFTLIYAILDSRDASFTWSNAGHLPPLVRPPSGEVRYLETGSVPMGVEDVPYESMTERLEPGAAIILYTDGLVERRGESLDAGFARLAAAVESGPAPPGELCRHVLARLLAPDDRFHDDVTAVVARLAP